MVDFFFFFSTVNNNNNHSNNNNNNKFVEFSFQNTDWLTHSTSKNMESYVINNTYVCDANACSWRARGSSNTYKIHTVVIVVVVVVHAFFSFFLKLSSEEFDNGEDISGNSFVCFFSFLATSRLFLVFPLAWDEWKSEVVALVKHNWQHVMTRRQRALTAPTTMKVVCMVEVWRWDIPCDEDAASSLSVSVARSVRLGQSCHSVVVSAFLTSGPPFWLGWRGGEGGSSQISKGSWHYVPNDTYD